MKIRTIGTNSKALDRIGVTQNRIFIQACNIKKPWLHHLKQSFNFSYSKVIVKVRYWI